MTKHSHAGHAAENYLIQKLSGASPERLVAILLEGAQQFIGQAMLHIERGDVKARAHAINKASAIVEALELWVDTENGGEVATNLLRIYEWWTNEIFDASQKGDLVRLEKVFNHMGDLRNAWLEAEKTKPLVLQQMNESGIIG